MLLSQIIYFRRFLDSKYCVGETSSIRKYQTSHICRWLFAVTSVFDEARKGVSLSLIRRPRNVVDVVAGRWRRNKRWRVWHNNNIVVVGHTWVSHRVESVEREVGVNALRVSLTRHNAKRFLLPENKSWYKCVLCFRTPGEFRIILLSLYAITPFSHVCALCERCDSRVEWIDGLHFMLVMWC